MLVSFVAAGTQGLKACSAAFPDAALEVEKRGDSGFLCCELWLTLNAAVLDPGLLTGNFGEHIYVSHA